MFPRMAPLGKRDEGTEERGSCCVSGGRGAVCTEVHRGEVGCFAQKSELDRIVVAV